MKWVSFVICVATRTALLCAEKN